MVIAFFSSFETYLTQIAWDKPISFPLAVRRSFEEWGLWGLLSPLVLWIAGKIQLEKNSLARWILLHVAVGLGFFLVYVTAYAWLLDGQHGSDGTLLVFRTMFKKMFFYHLEFAMVLYWLNVLAHHGWHYYERNRERQIEAALLGQELTQARLDALRMQLNPHFLFNTLHTISALIHENPERADRIVARLSELLRLNLDQCDQHEVTLRQELEFLNRYLEIEQTRFQDRLTVQMDFPLEIQDAFVPALILQPLVENAIRHGIEPREEMGLVTIAGRRNNGTIEFTISDNGSGLSGGEESSRVGIGLANTRSRLHHLYGAEQKLELKPAAGGGLEVCLSFPFHTELRKSDHGKNSHPDRR